MYFEITNFEKQLNTKYSDMSHFDSDYLRMYRSINIVNIYDVTISSSFKHLILQRTSHSTNGAASGIFTSFLVLRLPELFVFHSLAQRRTEWPIIFRNNFNEEKVTPSY